MGEDMEPLSNYAGGGAEAAGVGAAFKAAFRVASSFWRFASSARRAESASCCLAKTSYGGTEVDSLDEREDQVMALSSAVSGCMGSRPASWHSSTH